MGGCRRGDDFHDDRTGLRAHGACCGEDLRLSQAQPRRPGRGWRQENDATVPDVRESDLIAQRGRQRPAQLPVQFVQFVRTLCERHDRATVGQGLRAMSGAAGRGWRRRLHAVESIKVDTMQIILVSRSRKVPKTYDLACTHTRRKLIGTVAAIALTCAAAGGAVALAVASPRDRAVGEIQALRTQVDTQNQQLADVRAGAQRAVNALAQKLGELQAQAIRLDALGMRLTQAGKLDDGEFDFDQPPSIGGPESDGEDTYALPQSLDNGIADLSAQFDSQQSQLKALEDLLLDRKVDSSLRPTGMPVAGGYISSYFGRRADPFNGHRGFHAGLDIAVPKGSSVHAVAEGMVTYAGIRHGYGKVVEIDHGNGYMTRYAHNSKLLVHPGERVRVGTIIAKSGSTGHSTGPHVHFEVWYKNHTVNPLAYVRSHR
jgi:murein DD-endopeptidase MepM/ murein hydrolase activator NlpD